MHFSREIRVTIEHGHGNHLANEMSSVAYWYAEQPSRVAKPPTVAKRLPVLRDNQDRWLHDRRRQTTSHTIEPNREMTTMKARWQRKHPDR